MKKIFTTVAILSIILTGVPFVTHAQTTDCSTVTSSNFNSCCINNSTTTADVQNACRDYYSSGAPTTSQQVGGTQATNALNTTDTSYAGNPSLTPSTTSLSAINSCTQIKFDNLLDIAIWAKCIIAVLVIPGIFTLAFAVFLWGVFKFIRASDQKDKAESKNFIFMGLLGLFIMVSVWGILKILNTTLGINSTVPTLQTEYLNTKNANTK